MILSLYSNSSLEYAIEKLIFLKKNRIWGKTKDKILVLSFRIERVIASEECEMGIFGKM